MIYIAYIMKNGQKDREIARAKDWRSILDSALDVVFGWDRGIEILIDRTILTIYGDPTTIDALIRDSGYPGLRFRVWARGEEYYVSSDQYEARSPGVRRVRVSLDDGRWRERNDEPS